MLVAAALAALTAWPSTRDRTPIVGKLPPVARHIVTAICVLMAVAALVFVLVSALGRN
jgi:hypothetical protein